MTLVHTPLHATGDIFHVYADGLNGNDKNTGYDEAAPKKTAVSALAAFPDFIEHNCCLHLKNTFETSLDNNIIFDKWIHFMKTFIIDGGDELTTLSGPHTADIHTTKTIGLTTAGWSVDEHQGKWVQLTSGACTGQIRRVHENTATTLRVSRQWSEDPGACTFNIVEPKTCIGNNTGATALDIIPFPRGGGILKIQRLKFNDDNVQVKIESASPYECTVDLAALMFAKNKSIAITLETMLEATLGPSILDPDTFTAISENDHSTGISILNTGEVNLFGIMHLTANSIDAKKFTARACRFHNFGNGFRLRNVELYETQSIKDKAGGFITCASEYYSNIIESSTARGLLVRGSWCKIDYNASAPTIIRNNTTHGIEVKDNGYLWLNGALEGTGNGSSGVYLGIKATVEIDEDNPPTLTGNSGTVEVTIDGTTQKETWANIAAGASVCYPKKLLLAKATNVPSPDFKIDFYQSITPLKCVDGSYTFTRASTALQRRDGYRAWSTNYKAGSIILSSVDANVPRAVLIKGSGSGRLHGLLLESAGITNVFTAPCDLTNGAWTKTGVDVTCDASIDANMPDNITPVSKMVEQVGVAGVHSIAQSMGTIGNNETASYSVFAHAPDDGRSYGTLVIFDGTTYAYAIFRFDNGSASITSSRTGGTTLQVMAYQRVSPTPGFGNYGGSYRRGFYPIGHIVVKNVSGVSKTLTAQFYISTTTNTWAGRSFTGSASYPEGLRIWGNLGVLNPPLYEYQTYTHTSRLADGILTYVAGDNLGGENIGKGTHRFSLWFPAVNTTTTPPVETTILTISDGGDPNNAIRVYQDTSGRLNASTRKSGGNPGDVQLSANLMDDRIRDCQLSWDTNYLKLWTRDIQYDTIESAVDTSCDIPIGLDQLSYHPGLSKVLGSVSHFNEGYQIFLTGL